MIYRKNAIFQNPKIIKFVVRKCLCKKWPYWLAAIIIELLNFLILFYCYTWIILQEFEIYGPISRFCRPKLVITYYSYYWIILDVERFCLKKSFLGRFFCQRIYAYKLQNYFTHWNLLYSIYSINSLFNNAKCNL